MRNKLQLSGEGLNPFSFNNLLGGVNLDTLLPGAYPGGMHRMHVHPPSPPCASPPGHVQKMCIPPLPSLKG